MSTTGLDVFDKTLQTTHIWLNEISEELGIDKHRAWALLGSVLRHLRDRIPATQAAHFSAELPLILRGAYYDQYQPERQPTNERTAAEFIDAITQDVRRVGMDVDMKAVQAVLATVSRHVPEGQCTKIRGALPQDIRGLWSAASA
jgi:uncharacterized protein (DUF2267 family)